MSRPLLLSCESVSKAYGARSLFDDLTFGLFEGDQAGLVGPNGSGKSTLLKILAGVTSPDRGSRSLRGGIRVGYVPQDPVFDTGLTVDDILLAALAAVDDEDRPGRLAQARGRAGLADGGVRVDTLSGGWKKRLAIARELAAAPDIVLMDEPTNHLDVEGILWLERILQERARAFLVGLFHTEGRYSDFLARRDQFLRGQAAYQESLANTVGGEIEWLRRGAKARSTKAKGRIKEAGRLIDELADSRARTVRMTAGIDFTSSQRRTRRLLVARGLTKSFGGRPVIDGVDLVITPGTRVGLIGPNGSGKTTLLDMLAGTLEPDAGDIERAENLRVVRFEQERGGLDPAQSLRRALAPEGATITWQGRSVHVASWARRFLFRPDQLELPVGRLSGGEQARILIARLMRESADVLMLDEPTNDLDIPTLEVLEDSLAEFPGAVVLVTHDRFMLDRVSTAILALDGQGGAELFADFGQWESARATKTEDVKDTRGASAARERSRPKRFSYREQREWDSMEQTIHDAEAAVDACRVAAEDPSIATN